VYDLHTLPPLLLASVPEFPATSLAGTFQTISKRANGEARSINQKEQERLTGMKGMKGICSKQKTKSKKALH
jgi:hypothetical protein